MKKLKNNFTNVEQSKRLLELGVPKYSADMWYVGSLGAPRKYAPFPSFSYHFDGVIYERDVPCWSVGRLIEIHLKCCTTLNQNDAHIVISRFGIETGGLLQNMYDMVSECALLGRYDFSKLEG